MATSTHNKWEKLQFVTMLARMLKDCVILLNPWGKIDCCVQGSEEQGDCLAR